MRRRSCGVLLVAALVSCIRTPPVIVRAPVPDRISALELVGETSLPPLQRFPPVVGLIFGGISGLGSLARGTEMLGISDDRVGLRVYRFTVAISSFEVTPAHYIPLAMPSQGPARLDPEGIALLSSGHFIVASEGIGNEEPRVPPALIEYGPAGEFIRQLPVRDRFVPNPAGPLVRGVRPNMGFESLTLTPGGGRMFTAIETALAQDGDVASFDSGTRVRISEYVERRGQWNPAREFVYEIDPVQRPPFEPGIHVNGLVELLALGEDVLLALERSYVEEAAHPGRGVNRIRLYTVALAGASDVSAFDALREAGAITPVSKQLLMDLSEVPGLSPALAESLDNFEGLAFGPRLADGRESLILVSDDNFNATQRTWFLLFAIERGGGARQSQ